MSKLHLDVAAEKEAVDIGKQFMNSSDVVGDMSRTYGTDLSSVRLHTDDAAARKTSERGVDAFSTGKDVFFGKGVFDRSDPASRGLLAHELSHSLQQGIGGDMGGMTQSAPVGAEQGGILDWFRGKFGRKKKPEPEMEISGPLSVERNESEESLAYMKAMQGAMMTADQVPNRMPEARPGQLDQSAYAAYQNAFLGPEGAIAESDSVLPAQGSAGALVKLGIRQSSTEQAKADKAFRGSLFSNVGQDYSTYFQNLEQGGMDFDTVLPGTSRGTVKGSAGAYVTGGKLDQISSDMLSMFGSYAASDQGIEYLRQSIDTLGGAQVFEGDSDKVLPFLMRCILTVNNHAGVENDRRAGKFQKGEEAVNVAREAARTLLFLPTLADLSGPAKDALPETIRPLVDQYQALIAQIREKLAG